jgi:hypothetical protein
MTDHKKKGDFHKTSSHEDSVGGNKKAGAKGESNSRTGAQAERRPRRAQVSSALSGAAHSTCHNVGVRVASPRAMRRG